MFARNSTNSDSYNNTQTAPIRINQSITNKFYCKFWHVAKYSLFGIMHQFTKLRLILLINIILIHLIIVCLIIEDPTQPNAFTQYINTANFYKTVYIEPNLLVGSAYAIKSMDDVVKYENNPNIITHIQFLDQDSTFLVLSKSTNKDGVDDVVKYENNSHIFNF